MTISIRGARVIDPASDLDQVSDLRIGAGKIVTIGTASTGSNAQKTLNGVGLAAAPGLVGLSVALRGPSYGCEDSIGSETRTAAAGDATSLCCPPYIRPVLDAPAAAKLILDRARETGDTEVYLIGALTHGFDNKRPSELAALRDTGCVAFTSSLHGFANNRILWRALEHVATFNLTVISTSQDTNLVEGGLAHKGPIVSFLGFVGIPETAETVALAHNLLLMEQSGVHAHFSQLASARDIELVVQVQARGLPVTCDMTSHQLILTDEALVGLSSLYHVQPPLRTRVDREILREAVKNGVIQTIASHHQPHEAGAKNAPFVAIEPGVSGVELPLLLVMTLVQDDLFDLLTPLVRLSHGPAQTLRLPAGRLAVGQAADLVLLDPQGSTLVGENWYLKGQNDLFAGHCLLGRVRYTLVDGYLTHEG